MSTYFTTSEVAQNPESIFWLEKGQTGKTTMEDIQDAIEPILIVPPINRRL